MFFFVVVVAAVNLKKRGESLRSSEHKIAERPTKNEQNKCKNKQKNLSFEEYLQRKPISSYFETVARKRQMLFVNTSFKL